jgi:hypothetical protein
VTFTDKGPWTTTYDIERRGIYTGPETSGPISVGTGLTQTIPAADQRHRAASQSQPSASFPWAWILSLASIASALLLLAVRRRRRWGAA